MLCLVIARKHYTLDVVLAYFVTSRTFWAYHSVLAAPDIASRQEWWMPLLRFVERR
jgi:shingomyelin synthase